MKLLLLCSRHHRVLDGQQLLLTRKKMIKKAKGAADELDAEQESVGEAADVRRLPRRCEVQAA